MVCLVFFSIIFASRPPAFNESLKGTVPLSSFFCRKSELDNLNNSALDARHKSGVQSSQWVVLPDPLGFILQNSQKKQLILCCVLKRNHDKITNKELLVPLHDSSCFLQTPKSELFMLRFSIAGGLVQDFLLHLALNILSFPPIIGGNVYLYCRDRDVMTAGLSRGWSFHSVGSGLSRKEEL